MKALLKLFSGKDSPVNTVISGAFGLLKDKSGKISSKRIGAGACVTAGIAMLTNGNNIGGSIALVAGIVMFALTRFEWIKAPGPEQP